MNTMDEPQEEPQDELLSALTRARIDLSKIFAEVNVPDRMKLSEVATYAARGLMAAEQLHERLHQLFYALRPWWPERIPQAAASAAQFNALQRRRAAFGLAEPSPGGPVEQHDNPAAPVPPPAHQGGMTGRATEFKGPVG